MFSIGLVATTAFFDKAITFSEAGVTFPLYLAPFLHFRRERRWHEVSRIRFVPEKKGALRQGKIDICLGKEHIRISLAQFKKIELEALLLALNIWAQHCEQDAELKLLQENLSNEKLGLQETSYTQVWEAEMNRRFSSTSFVPKQAGQTLRDGAIVVTKQIAYGGMSAVYLCQLDQTELVVLKEFVVPNLDSSLQSKARELFEREAKLLMKLSHPRIAKIRDYFVEEQRTYLLLDYIQGTDLRQTVMQKGKQDEDIVLGWAKQIVDILIYLHDQNPPILHRDLTPDNIVITSDQQVTLIDFGAANEFVGTATGTLVGKESFIAPEQFRGETVPQSDIYSLGATMHYLLTGEDPEPLSQSIPAQINPDVTQWLSDIVAKCTEFDAENRFASAHELSQMLSSRREVIRLKELA
jgi:tRNA A-37 threonylcarbamoyl transferase component Bud32